MNNSEASPLNQDIHPWGPIATVSIGILILVSTFLAQIGAEALLERVWALSGPGRGRFSFLPFGLLVSLESVVSALIGSLMIGLAIRLRQRRYPFVRVRTYLGLYRFTWQALAFWAGLTLVYLISMDAVSHWSGRPLIPDFIIEAYATSIWPFLFWIAIGICAPFFEELFFRGFLLAGFRKTRRRTVIAVVAISGVWAGVHLQYGWYEMIWIFGLGLVFGAARLRSGSLWLPVLLHMQCNLLATFQVARMPAL